MDLTKRLKSAYDICVGSSELTKTHKDKIHYYLAVRTIVFKITTGGAPDVEQMNRRVRDLVKDALISDGVEEIFKLGEKDGGEIDILMMIISPNWRWSSSPIRNFNCFSKCLLRRLASLKDQQSERCRFH